MAEIIYSKYSRDRDPRFSICTLIFQDGEKKWVEKRPFTAAAAAHVNNLETTYRELTRLYRDTRLYPCPVSVEDGVARFPFIEGESFQDRLVELCQRDDKAAILALCQEFVGLMRESGPTERFVKSPEFVQVFGNIVLPDGFTAKKFSNVDMIFENLVEDASGQIAVLDYEWCFPFQIPLEFIIWRSLHISFGKCGYTEFADGVLCPFLGISVAWIETFWEMERSLNRSVIKKNSVDVQYPGYAERGTNYGIRDMQGVFKATQCHTQVFYDTGKGLNEAESSHFYHSYREDYSLTIPVVKNIRLLRVDPSDAYAIVTLKKCCAAGVDGVFDLPWQANGFVSGNTILFDTSDPQIWITELPEKIEEIRIVLNVVQVTPDIAENYRRQIYIRTQAEERSREEMTALEAAKEEVSQKLADNEAAYQAELADREAAYQAELAGRETVYQAELADREAAYQAELADQETAKAEISQELAHYKTHYFAAINQREDLSRRLAEVQNAYNVISNAAFWKMTKPLRVVLDFIKRLLRSNRYTRLFCKGLKCLKENGVRYTWRKVKDKLRHRQNFLALAARPLYTQEELDAQRTYTFSRAVKFSIVVPLYNTPQVFLHEMIRSVLDQTYGNWELCMADGSDQEHTYVGRICQEYARKDKRVVYRKLDANKGISENTNACIGMATGDYIGLLDHDDLLHPAVLYDVMTAICEKDADFIYTDEKTFFDKPADGYDPHFKPDFSPDTLRSYNYICHFTVFSRQLMENAGGKFRSEFDGSQDYDLILRLTEKAEHIVHIAKSLYYWRIHKSSTSYDVSTKPYITDAAKDALAEHLERIKLSASVRDSRVSSIYHIHYEIKGTPLISILIPNKDHIDDLKKCVQSILEKTTYSNWEIIVVENNSTEKSTFDYYKELETDPRIRVVSWAEGFNYSAINNYGVQFAKGEHFLLLNNDTEVISPNWLEEMLMFSQRSDVGAVGAMLYYPDDTIQHAGVIVGLGGVAAHSHRHFRRGDGGYANRLTLVQNLSAVTGACMMLRREVWEQVGGLDESFVVALNDVDLCLRIRQAGYLVVWTPYAELYHYESKSRGYENTPEKEARFEDEKRRFRLRWEQELLKGDPYYNPNLTLDREDFSLR